MSFLHSVEQAESELEQELVESWVSAGKIRLDDDGKMMGGDWRAIDTFLKRRRPKDYSDQTFINLDKELSADGSAIERLDALSNAIVDQITSGKLSADAGAIILRTIDDRRKLIETIDHEQRLKETEERLKKLGA